MKQFVILKSPSVAQVTHSQLGENSTQWKGYYFLTPTDYTKFQGLPLYEASFVSDFMDSMADSLEIFQTALYYADCTSFTESRTKTGMWLVALSKATMIQLLKEGKFTFERSLALETKVKPVTDNLFVGNFMTAHTIMQQLSFDTSELIIVQPLKDKIERYLAEYY